jgi:DNA-3-methyladenine glycosylase I
MLVLEGAQAGLSWLTILRKRESYREAFEGFEPATIAAWTEADVERLMGNAGIVRNRRKIHSVIRNAQGVLEIQQSEGSFSAFLWSFTANHPVHNSWTSAAEIPTRTRESDLMSSALNRHGFSFTGSTICYAFMQAVGMVNDHLVSCFRHEEIMRLPSANR